MIATNLLGALVEPRYPDLVGNPNGPWNVSDPNLSGEHTAEVRAVWNDVGLKCLCVTPHGFSFETYLVNLKVRTA